MVTAAIKDQVRHYGRWKPKTIRKEEGRDSVHIRHLLQRLQNSQHSLNLSPIPSSLIHRVCNNWINRNYFLKSHIPMRRWDWILLENRLLPQLIKNPRWIFYLFRVWSIKIALSFSMGGWSARTWTLLDWKTKPLDDRRPSRGRRGIRPVTISAITCPHPLLPQRLPRDRVPCRLSWKDQYVSHYHHFTMVMRWWWLLQIACRMNYLW